ncbi:centrosome-associated zinc finger protein CP190 [Drosophila innubila]|uniref:centrosome-associated zinc finger protein CP190 n=1 Tax=Drosophila innubila TaxID=198719 RepID=UPI00148D88D4|nr:centrosome-associated zinc finger protein CP190 [Drosophila innubila]XP_034486263.1 centrosome-associated zinc finger protein CP190 [Drosophila innubila]XP_034486264.1 centrosome-associated zinc finger protein CP190 [Drosophila innubila]
MGEVKSVKVDNWGVFFLQKLQNFFNKTDYCDLTLQFRDNSQLKVHRLVLSACTDYFNVLEQTCEIIDDALIMPAEFQADVVVPIVNFMYTGTLEFELKMYGKLLRTAKEMNMTVLLKLLEAHRRTMENVNRQQRPPSPKGIRRRPVVPSGNANTTQQRVSLTTPQNRGGNTPGVTSTVRTNVQQQQPRGLNTPAILRSGGINNRTQYVESTATTTFTKQEPTSPFEQLRKGYNNNKRPAQTSLLSPPSKKPSLEEVKEFAEQQRMRKQIAAEFGDHGDPEYDNLMLYDDVHTGDDDDDDVPPQPSTSKQQQQHQQQQQQQTQQQVQSSTQTQMEHGTTTIILKQDSPSQTPTIIVKDSSNTKLNHTKIIAEVLRQYPHIVKGHKNIKLKIMPNSPVEKSPSTVKQRGSPVPSTTAPQASTTSPHKKLHVSFKPDKPMITTQQQQQKSTQKLTTAQTTTSGEATQSQAVASTATVGSTTATSAAAAQKRRIDSKTMHALIALGAENTTGPWLCLRCGVNGRPISIPSYRGFRRHLINTHKETINPALCEHCGWRSANNRELHFHMYTEHQVKSLLYNFAECALCNRTYLSKGELEQHINEAHTDENKQQCIYCNKVFAQELQLYRHMKSYHKAQALEDGIIDETDEEYMGSQDEDEQLDDEDGQEEETEDEPMQEEKVRILSDISLPATSAVIQQQANDEREETETEAESDQLMHQQSQEQEVKFVGADGNEVELTDEQRKEILSQLNQQQAGAPSGGVVMVLSEPEGDAKQEGDAKSSAGTEEEYDDSQIYSELGAGSVESSSKKSEVADESKESIDNLEWAENLLSKHDLETEQNSKEPKPDKRRDDISEKLKELTGDWTEDENEDEDDVTDKPATTELTAPDQSDAGIKEESAQVTDVVKEATIEQPEPEPEPEPELEDDIDLALESLHKGEDETVATTEPAAEAIATSSTAEVSQEKEKPEEPIAKSDANVLDEPSVDVKAHIKEEDLSIKKENEVEEEFIKEDAPQTTTRETEAETVEINNESSTENNAETSGTSVDDVNLEAETIRKGLIEELIAEAETAEPDAEASGQPEDAEEVPPTQLPVVDGSETLKDEVSNAETSLEQPAATNNEEKSEATTTTVVTTDETEEKPNTSDVASIDDKTGTQEKLKSLMSEWVDDDDDDNEDENGVSAAAKEQL